MVLASDEIRTYAMFNYEQIQWITHMDNYEGLKGSAAYVSRKNGYIKTRLETSTFSNQF